jgi:hypothetical protein
MDAGRRQKDAARTRLLARRGGVPASDDQLVDEALNIPAADLSAAVDDSAVNRFVEDEMATMRVARRSHHNVSTR